MSRGWRGDAGGMHDQPVRARPGKQGFGNLRDGVRGAGGGHEGGAVFLGQARCRHPSCRRWNVLPRCDQGGKQRKGDQYGTKKKSAAGNRRG